MRISEEQKSFNQFVKDLGEVLSMTDTQRTRFAEILDDRMKEIADRQASEALDREFNRGDYRY